MELSQKISKLNLEPTKLLYLEDTYLEKAEAKVVGLLQSEQDEKKWSVFLDQTVFYPQGGGQCFDQGWIRCMDEYGAVSEFRVESVFLDKQTSVVSHNISIVAGMILPDVGSTVEMQVDLDRRILMSNYHTVGHMLDLVCGRGDVAGLGRAFKGNHNPDLAFVKFPERLDLTSGKEELMAEIEEAVNALRVEALKIVAVESEGQTDGAPEGKTYREVYFEGYEDLAVGCGGTHLKDTSQVWRVVIKDVKSKKGGTTIKYGVEV